jgi:hypothetical protein
MMHIILIHVPRQIASAVKRAAIEEDPSSFGNDLIQALEPRTTRISSISVVKMAVLSLISQL